MTSKYIYLFRHGETTYNKAKIFSGWHNPPLTKKGIQHAKIIAKKLKNKNFQIAFQTRLSRSQDTLNYVLKYHPECSIIKKDDRIIERNYGKLNSTKHSDYIKKHGIKQFNTIHRSFNIPPPKGESFADVESRVKSFIQDLIKLIKKKKVNVAISAHGNSIRLFRKIWEKASIKATCSWHIPYDKVFTYKVNL